MSANPLSFFEGFISGGDFKDFFEDFKRENPSRPELLKNDAAFKARVKKRITEEADQAISSTTNRVMSLDLNLHKVDFLNGVFDLLYDYYIEVNINPGYFSDSVDDLIYTLTYIANYLKNKFSSLSGLSQHRFFGIESSNEHVHAANNIWGYKYSVLNSTTKCDIII